MRKQNHKWNIVGRRVLVLLLLCGLLFPIAPKSDAARVTYEYTWIQDVAGLPTDNAWHDYFIAWEHYDYWNDSLSKNTVWFTDYHWYNTSGDDNIDRGGSHWMEYEAASQLWNTTDISFTAEESYGHMQIKYAGIDKDNDNSPKYYIRVSKMNGQYMYFTRYEPTSKEKDADAFTFVDHGTDFHIFVNIGGKADRYLTRHERTLRTTESSSSDGGEKSRPLRVYKRSFTIVEGEENNEDVIGKTTLYEYTWVNTPEELLALANNSGDWTDIMLAWEDANGGGTSNPNKVWYSKETWYDESNKPNYDNDFIEWQYYSNDTLGSDGYSSPYADTFITPNKVSHYQVKFCDWDNDNPIDGYNNNTQASPRFFLRFHIIQNKYLYPGSQNLYDVETRTPWTIQLRLDEDNDEDIYGSVHIFFKKDGGDTMFTREKNRVDVSNYSLSRNWEFPFRIYTCRAVEYDAIVKDFTIDRGATYSVDRSLLLAEGVTITVEDGGVMMVDRELLNNGKIVVKKGGTLIVNEGAYVMAYNYNTNGKIELDGGNLIIMDGAKVLCDQGEGTLKAVNGATVLNRGLLMVGRSLSMNNNSCMINEANALFVAGGRLASDRGGVVSLSFEEIEKRVEWAVYTQLLSNNSKIINRGTINQSKVS